MKLLVSMIFFSCALLLYGMDQEDAIIPSASYLIYERASDIVGGVAGGSKTVTFYTFDGNSIKTIEHSFQFPRMERLLDPNAPKPQPTSYTIKYWPAINIGIGTKGEPGYFILFFDKNGNKINSFRLKQYEMTFAAAGNKLDTSLLSENNMEQYYVHAQADQLAHINRNMIKPVGCRLF